MGRNIRRRYLKRRREWEIRVNTIPQNLLKGKFTVKIVFPVWFQFQWWCIRESNCEKDIKLNEWRIMCDQKTACLWNSDGPDFNDADRLWEGGTHPQPDWHWLNATLLWVCSVTQVSEAHLLSSLSPRCQHLIMIGDHQQLRPPTPTTTSLFAITNTTSTSRCSSVCAELVFPFSACLCSIGEC